MEYQKREIVKGSILKGAATGGSNTTLEDTSKEVSTDLYQNGRMHILKGGTHYVKTISSNTANTWTFEALNGGVEVGEGDEYYIEG